MPVDLSYPDCDCLGCLKAEKARLWAELKEIAALIRSLAE